MSATIEAFQKSFQSSYSCDEVIKKMQKVSKIKLDKDFNEEQFNKLFFGFCTNNFKNQSILFFLGDKDHLDVCNENIFNLSHYLLTNKKDNENKIYYSQIKLLYQTFFFFQYDKTNKANNFSFYEKFPENLVELNEYEIYILNIGKAMLGSNYRNDLIEILFSEETPLFLRNIILICFQYIRRIRQNVEDFISFCVPCLNFRNLYYLNEALKRDLGYQLTEFSQMNYYLLENFLTQQNNNIIINEETRDDFVDFLYEINDKEISEVNEEELGKYFCFTNSNKNDEDFSLLFTPDNLKNNKDKFLQLTKFDNKKNNLDIGKGYKIDYDNPQIKDKIINAFSFMYLLKNKKINKLDNHFFQIYNFGNIKINLFSYLLEKYLTSINELLTNSITNENKKKLFENSGFYKLDNEYVFLININEENEKIFYLKLNLGIDQITSNNKNEDYKVYQVKLSNYSSVKTNTGANEMYTGDIEEDVLYNFGNYSFENDLRTFFKNTLKGKKDVFELPRLYFLLNYAIPISLCSYYFITNVKYGMKKNCSYGYGEFDFVLKNGSNEDIVIDNNFLPYKEKIFMTFPKKEHSNNNKIILKRNSIIFFEFKVSFPQFTWKNKFSHLLKKIKKFLDIYKMRGLYNNEYIQIYFIYDNFPDIYFIIDIKRFINNMSNNLDFSINYEFGIYYFTRGVSLINNQMLENNIKKDMKNNMKNMMKNMMKKMMKDFAKTLNIKNEEERDKEIDDLISKYDFEDNEQDDTNH